MKFKFLILFLLVVTGAKAQTTLDTLLATIAQNNLMLKANSQYWNARDIEYRTGLTPYDPTVEFDYMIGSPAGAGNQKDFAITQRFDFPTAYLRKRQLSNVQIEQSQWQQQAYKKDLLLKAKQTALTLIYQNKRQAELGRRLEAVRQLVNDYQTKLDKGDGTILEVNKAKLQLLAVQNDWQHNQAEIAELQVKLSELNGEHRIVFNDTTYPPVPILPDFETLDADIESNDPLIKVYQYNERITTAQIGVQRALALPKPEVGYHSQGILGQSYKGFHIGTSIPLWENRNRVKTEKANLVHNQLQITAHRVEHRNENRRHYEEYLGRKASIDKYNVIIATQNNTALLSKALMLGQITTIEYFLELSYYYSACDKYLQIEHEYHQAIAALYKYQL